MDNPRITSQTGAAAAGCAWMRIQLQLTPQPRELAGSLCEPEQLQNLGGVMSQAVCNAHSFAKCGKIYCAIFTVKKLTKLCFDIEDRVLWLLSIYLETCQ